MQSAKGEWAQRRIVQPSTVPQIVRRLAAFGAHAPVWRLGRRYAAGGATVRLSLKASPEGAERDTHDLALGCRALRAGLPVTVAVEDLNGAIAAAHAVALSERFRRFASAAGVDNDLLNLCLSASDLPPRAVRAALRPLLGRGPRYLMLSPANVPLPAGESVWRLIHDPDGLRPRFWPALAAGTRSRCLLLPGEASENAVSGVRHCGTAGLRLGTAVSGYRSRVRQTRRIAGASLREHAGCARRSRRSTAGWTDVDRSAASDGCASEPSAGDQRSRLRRSGRSSR